MSGSLGSQKMGILGVICVILGGTSSLDISFLISRRGHKESKDNLWVLPELKLV